jgi:hypothetical protein
MNFEIKSQEEVSREFLKNNIVDFNTACGFISSLPYKRNKNKNNLLLGIFKMDAEYNSKIENTLIRYKLDYIPEAHNYLKINNEYFDFTLPNAKYEDIKSKLLQEIEIEFNQINSEKVSIHKEFLQNWVTENSEYGIEEIWKIREECIIDLQN